jgi:hypothetical protein
MYHDIRKHNEGFYPKRYSLPSFITPKKFSQTLDVIKSNKNPFLTRDINFSENMKATENLNILTFDDGLADHLEVARNLHSRNIKAIFFVPYAPIFDSIVINSHKIQFIFSASNIQNLVDELHFFYFDNYDWKKEDELDQFLESRWKNNTWPREMVFFTRVLREAGNKEWRQKTLNFLFSKYVSSDEKAFATDFYLSPDEVSEISDLGHIIGGHGNYSLDLRFEDSKTAEEEILISKKLVNKYSSENFFYAYANGGVTSNDIDLLRKNNFKLAFCTDNLDISVQQTKTNCNYLIPRINGTKLL